MKGSCISNEEEQAEAAVGFFSAFTAFVNGSRLFGSFDEVEEEEDCFFVHCYCCLRSMLISRVFLANSALLQGSPPRTSIHALVEAIAMITRRNSLTVLFMPIVQVAMVSVMKMMRRAVMAAGMLELLSELNRV